MWNRRSTRKAGGRSRAAALSAVGVVLTLALVGRPAGAQEPAPCPEGSAAEALLTEADLPPGLRTGPHEVVVNGVRLWYRVAGATPAGQPPVVFLHGGPGQGSQSFATLIGPRLECALRMVYFDQRGSGRSERPWTGAYAMETLVEDIEGLRQKLGVAQIALIGHSFGGLLALEYAAKYPERVSRLVFAAGVSDIRASCRSQRERLAELHPEAHARAAAQAEGSDDCAVVFQALPDAERGAFFQGNMFPDTTVAAVVTRADTANGLRNTGELSNALFRAGLLEARFAAHDRLTMPVLVLAGRHDHQIGLEAPRALARRLPDARLAVYDRSGHFLYVDEPERFADDVTAFLTTPPEQKP